MFNTYILGISGRNNNETIYHVTIVVHFDFLFIHVNKNSMKFF